MKVIVYKVILVQLMIMVFMYMFVIYWLCQSVEEERLEEN